MGIPLHMVALAESVIPVSARGHLRPVNSLRDLRVIADLIELCFQDTLDLDGQDYLRELRSSADNTRFLSWASPLFDNTEDSGYVWEEGGRIVGNLSLIPIQSKGRNCLLIANVAIHPDFRGKGIGRTLTTTAIEYARRRKLPVVWLQVRKDNPIAVNLYRSLGFRDHSLRTTWQSNPTLPSLPVPGSLRFGPRRSAHWPEQRSWLERLYPAELAWHLTVDWQALRPGLRGSVYRIFSLNYPRHWIVERDDQLLGAVTWIQTPTRSDPLLLSLPPLANVEAVQTLLQQARQQLSTKRLLTLNFPAGVADESIRSAGFSAEYTLIWMELPLHS